MLANTPASGLNLLARMAEAAAAKAHACLLKPIRLARCEAVELRDAFAGDNVTLESWSVRADGRAVTVSVFATVPRDGGARMAGTGRFTFTTGTSQTKEHCA